MSISNDNNVSIGLEELQTQKQSIQKKIDVITTSQKTATHIIISIITIGFFAIYKAIYLLILKDSLKDNLNQIAILKGQNPPLQSTGSNNEKVIILTHEQFKMLDEAYDELRGKQIRVGMSDLILNQPQNKPILEILDDIGMKILVKLKDLIKDNKISDKNSAISYLNQLDVECRKIERFMDEKGIKIEDCSNDFIKFFETKNEFVSKLKPFLGLLD